MKRCILKALLLVTLSVSCVINSACQATPDEDFVVSHADEKDYENKNGTVVPVQEAENDNEWNWKEFTYKDSFQGADDKVQINVDINGRYLDVKIPVLRISHHSFTADDLKRKASALMPADSYYDPVKLLEPEIIQSWIDEADARIVKAKYNSDLTNAEKEKIIEQAETAKKQYTDMKENGKYEPEKSVTDWKTHNTGEHYYSLERKPNPDKTGTEELFIRTKKDEDGNFGFMQFSDSNGSSFRANEMEFYKANEYYSRGFCYGVRDISKDPNNTMTTGDALKAVDAKLKNAGFDMHIAAILGGDFGRTFWYYPTYLGIDYLCMQKQSEYAEEHRPECLYVQMKGDEIYHLKQICATDVVVENDKLPLLSKDEVLSAFKKYMQTIYTRSFAANSGESIYPDEMLEDANQIRTEVSRMSFGYVRIPIEDKPTEFRLVPAWVFYGQTYLYFEGQESKKVFHEVANPGIADGQILMVVNAIDGSYIEAEREMFE